MYNSIDCLTYTGKRRKDRRLALLMYGIKYPFTK